MPPFPAGPVTIGLDVGQRKDYTAIAILQTELRPRLPYALDDERYEMALDMIRAQVQPYAGPTEVHHIVRQLRRLPLNTPYPVIVREIVHKAQGAVSQCAGMFPRLFIDATGVGLPVVDMLREAGVPAQMWPCYFVHGEHKRWVREGERDARSGRRDLRPMSISLGKAYLVARLQALLQSNRIHMAQSVDAAAMQEELRKYEVRISEQAKDTYGAFAVGAHDDMVTALGLATLDDSGRPDERSERASKPVLPGVF